MLKDPNPRAPNYYLIRDDFRADEPLPTEWNIWILAKEVDVSKSPARVTGKYGVDLDVFMAEPANPKWTTRQDTNKYLPSPSRPYLVEKEWLEMQTQLRAKQGPGGGFLAVLYPRFHDEEQAGFESLAGGKGVKVVGPRGTDWAFLSAERVKWEGDGITFAGTAAAIRLKGEVYEVVFLEPGRVTVAGAAAVADKPMRKVLVKRDP